MKLFKDIKRDDTLFIYDERYANIVTCLVARVKEHKEKYDYYCVDRLIVIPKQAGELTRFGKVFTDELEAKKFFNAKIDVCIKGYIRNENELVGCINKMREQRLALEKIKYVLS